MMRRKAPSTAMPISTSCSSWLPSMWWWPSPTGSTTKVPTSRPSSAGAGPSFGLRWLPAGYVFSCTWVRWSPHSVDPLHSTPCEDLSNLLGSAAGSDALEQISQESGSDWYFVTSWHSPGWLQWVWKPCRGEEKKSLDLLFLILKFKKKLPVCPQRIENFT